MTHLTRWSTRRYLLAAATAVLLPLLAIPPWRVVAQDKPAANPAAPDKPNPTSDASAAEDLSTVLERLDIEELAQKDKQLMQLLAERSAVQRELNDLVKVHGYGETQPKVLEMKKRQETVDLDVAARARRVKELLARPADHQISGWIDAARLRVQPADDGVVDQVSVHQGDRVKKGDLLIQLDARRAQTALARSAAKVEIAESQLGRVRALANQAVLGSQQDVDQKQAELKVAQADLNATKQDLAETRIISPIDGTVGEVSVRAGERVARGQTLATVVETGALKLTASIPLSELAVYSVGKPIAIRVKTYPNRAFTAQISGIAPIADGGSETVAIEATLTGDTTGLLPNMSARATLATEPKESAKQP